MNEANTSPAWASTAVADLLDGCPQDASVLASGRAAAYLSVADPAAVTPVLALLAPGAVRLPIGVCLPAGGLPGAGDTVRIGEGAIAAGDRVWRVTRWWDPRPRVPGAGLLRHAPGLLAVVAREPSSSFGLPLAHALGLAAALASGDAEPALEAIGLGPGLTPAADDVVAGALAALALAGRLDDGARAAIEARAATHTTALSAALLSAAGRGQVVPQAARLLSLLAAGAPADRLRLAAGELYRVGATSGRALCAGIAGALAAAGRPVPPPRAGTIGRSKG